MEESNFEKKNNNENVCDNVNSSNVKPDTKIKFKFNEWFEILTGMEEDEFRKLDYPVFSKNEDGTLSLQTKKGGKYNCGEFTIYQLGELRRAFYKKMSELSVGNQKAAKERKQEEKNANLNPNANNGSNEEFVPIELLTRGDSNSRYVDVSFLQALPENREGVFQVASNFNGVESVSESIAPDTKFFTQHYCYDHTQGPIASISCGPAAIARVHAAFFDEKTHFDTWRQTTKHQINFLEDVSEYFPVKNGYVMFSELPKDKRTFLKPSQPEYDQLLEKVKIGYHKNVQVTSNGNEIIDDLHQTVDQVFCAAVNVGQGSSGYFNYQVNNGKAQFILDAVYEATYLSAILHNRKKLYLTLIGGGVFGNDKSWIYNSIIKAHKKYGIKKSGLETVYVVFYSYFDLEEGFPTNLRQNKIPFRWVEYKSNEKRFKECFLCESLTKNKKSPKKKKREEKNDEMEVVREEEETKKKN